MGIRLACLGVYARASSNPSDPRLATGPGLGSPKASGVAGEPNLGSSSTLISSPSGSSVYPRQILAKQNRFLPTLLSAPDRSLASKKEGACAPKGGLEVSI